MKLFGKKNNSATGMKQIVNKKKILSFSGKTIQTDWVITLFLFVLLLLTAIGWSVIQYLHLEDVAIENNEGVASSKELIDSKKVDSVVSKYNKKNTRFSNLAPGFIFSTAGSGSSYESPVQEAAQEQLLLLEEAEDENEEASVVAPPAASTTTEDAVESAELELNNDSESAVGASTATSVSE